MYRPAIYFPLSYQDHCYLNSSELVGKLKQYCACTKMHYFTPASEMKFVFEQESILA